MPAPELLRVLKRDSGDSEGDPPLYARMAAPILKSQGALITFHLFSYFRLQWQRDAYSFNDFIMPKVLSGFPLT